MTILSRLLALALGVRRAAILAHVSPRSPLHLAPRFADAAAVTRALVALSTRLDVEGPKHTARCSAWARAVACELGVRGAALVAIERGARLHDIGKIAVPDEVIHKPGLYDERDWEALRVHSDVGARMIEGIPGLCRAAGIVAAHHEHWDGGGYPRRLAGKRIPLGARIFAVVDSLDAMTRTGEEREWGAPLSGAAAMAELKALAGVRYDPACVEAFASVLERVDSSQSVSKPCEAR